MSLSIGRRSAIALGLMVTMLSPPALAGPFAGPTETGHATDPAIPAGSTLFVEWAEAIDPQRTDFAPRGSTAISESGFNSLGDLSATEIANGESPGYLTVTFPTGIANGRGADFAVFENGFVFPSDPNLLAELAYVEVSSNGEDFVRFPAVSRNTQQSNNYGSGTNFVGYDATNIHNLAGKHASGYGTPFDLDDVATDPLVAEGQVDLDDIQYVKLVDIPGNGSFFDSEGNQIFDNWLTPGDTGRSGARNDTGGFDFQLDDEKSIGVINSTGAVPEPTTALLIAGGGLAALGRRRGSA
jgi:hypothetical protein